MRLQGQETVWQGLTHEIFSEIIDVSFPFRIELAFSQDVVKDRKQVWCLANKIWERIEGETTQFIEINRYTAVKEGILHHLRVVQGFFCWVCKYVPPIIPFFKLLDQVKVIEY